MCMYVCVCSWKRVSWQLRMSHVSPQIKPPPSKIWAWELCGDWQDSYGTSLDWTDGADLFMLQSAAPKLAWLVGCFELCCCWHWFFLTICRQYKPVRGMSFLSFPFGSNLKPQNLSFVVQACLSDSDRGKIVDLTSHGLLWSARFVRTKSINWTWYRPICLL